MKVHSHYVTLGISRDSTAEEIRSAWRTRARATHPDRPGGFAADFAAASEANNVLGDFFGRRAYNSQLALENDPCSVCDTNGRVYKQRGFTERVGKICPTCGGTGYVARPKR